MDKTTLFFLIDKYLCGTASAEEKFLLDKYYTNLEQNGTGNLSEQEKVMIKQEMYRNILHNISGSKIIPLYKRSIIKRIAAAASILLILSTGAYFVFINKRQKKIALTEVTNKDVAAPKVTKATITLANGKQIFLAGAASGILVQQGNVSIVKLADGQIGYNGTGSEIQYNTLTNPKGSNVINLTLSDGSRVWLNAESSLKYPISFIGNERKVEITGEGYFEVTHDEAKKFFVNANGITTEVLGTHFNVNAYKDEENTKVTLLEGSVKVSSGQQSTAINPGEQAQSAGGDLKVVKANVDEVMAWRQGFFYFERADLKTILREFGRWYDVEVVYEGAVKNRRFLTIVKRSSTLKSVLEMLQDNDIIFSVEGKMLIVKSG